MLSVFIYTAKWIKVRKQSLCPLLSRNGLDGTTGTSLEPFQSPEIAYAITPSFEKFMRDAGSARYHALSRCHLIETIERFGHR